MPKIEIYSSRWCPFCVRAKMLLDSKNVSYTEIDVDAEPQQRALMRERTQRTSVPQIFIGDTHVGGCDDLYALERNGQLDPLLNAE